MYTDNQSCLLMSFKTEKFSVIVFKTDSLASISISELVRDLKLESVSFNFLSAVVRS